MGEECGRLGVLSQRCCIIKRGLKKPLNYVRTVFSVVWSENRVLPVQYVTQTTTLRCALWGIRDGDFLWFEMPQQNDFA